MSAGDLARTVRKRFTSLIRSAGPRPDDAILLACLPSPESSLALSLLHSLERRYETTVTVLELVPRGMSPILADLAGGEADRYVWKPLSGQTYTAHKLQALEYAAGMKDPLIVIPYTADQVAEYLMAELARGEVRGLLVDSVYRTAYPLSSTTNAEVRELVGSTPIHMHATTALLIEQIQPQTSPQSAAAAYRRILRALRRYQERARRGIAS